MTGEPIVAIAVSARGWPDALRQVLADHGGGRLRLTAMSPADLEDEDFTVLLVDDICSFLDRALVREVHRDGKVVIGVHGDQAGRSYLESLGVDATIDAAAPVSDFVSAIRRVGPKVDAAAEARPVHRAGPDVTFVSGVSGGVGTTEIALGLGMALGGVVLLDIADRPSLAQRTGLRLHPNLATAAEALDHGNGSVDAAVQRVTADVGLVAGSRSVPASSGRIVAALVEVASYIVVDAGTRSTDFGISVDREVLVGAASPVGVTRLLDRLGSADALPHVVLNRASRSRYQRWELASTVGEEVQPASLTFVPEDPRVALANWNCSIVGRGPFRSAVDDLVGALGRAAA